MATTISPKEKKTREKKATPKSAAAARKAVAQAPVAQPPVVEAAAPAKRGRGAKMQQAGGDWAPGQQPLNGMPDVDPRIPELDEACKAAKAHQAKSKSEREELRERLDEIGQLLKDNDLPCYIHNGTKFYIEPGSPKIKMAVVKTE